MHINFTKIHNFEYFKDYSNFEIWFLKKEITILITERNVEYIVTFISYFYTTL